MAVLCLASRTRSDDSFEAKLIAARGMRSRSTANMNLKDCDSTAKCASTMAIPAPKIWRRRSSKKQQQDPTASSPEMLQQLDLSDVDQITVPSLDTKPNDTDEWTRDFMSLVGLNDA